MVYNLINCSGWEGSAGSWVAGAGCMKARIGIIILFFIIAVVRKWGGEEIGIGFSFLFALIGGLLTYLVIIFISGSFRMAFIIGILVSLGLGYGFGIMFGEGGDY